MSQNFQNVKEVENAAKVRMDKALADMQHAISQMRTGRASVNLLEPIKVEAYGTMNPINHLATLHVPEPGMIVDTLMPSARRSSMMACVKPTSPNLLAL